LVLKMVELKQKQITNQLMSILTTATVRTVLLPAMQKLNNPATATVRTVLLPAMQKLNNPATATARITQFPVMQKWSSLTVLTALPVTILEENASLPHLVWKPTYST